MTEKVYTLKVTTSGGRKNFTALSSDILGDAFAANNFPTNSKVGFNALGVAVRPEHWSMSVGQFAADALGLGNDVDEISFFAVKNQDNAA